MLSKDKKLNKDLFNKVFSTGKTIHGETLYIKFTKNNNETKRFAVVVPKKVEKMAVKRVFLKRKIFNVLKDIYNNIKPNIDCIIFFKNKDIENLKEEISSLLNKTNSY
ncbi:ribonuclease P protein component [Candidatus Campbellbacteria bacterium CG22_combo_CG10-13_8_21_14_all_36_13]|uniref:Ribonuclease P protein component n=1 Tax=Candidatus Campbellbacteria bacterium CG22_combo_CG10-13_8_21_14_all_36_13 TaxID=1974529 RepID=A0A2H0DZ34_9BACT|nr:MAG: ribonuclease P protein component [Candidatus Campbellbacteria bacterium CG22_combo_CG10-13_8_21_14_all_36_13]